jgi:hypothetical protein
VVLLITVGARVILNSIVNCCKYFLTQRLARMHGANGVFCLPRPASLVLLD